MPSCVSQGSTDHRAEREWIVDPWLAKMIEPQQSIIHTLIFIKVLGYI